MGDSKSLGIIVTSYTLLLVWKTHKLSKKKQNFSIKRFVITSCLSNQANSLWIWVDCLHSNCEAHNVNRRSTGWDSDARFRRVSTRPVCSRPIKAFKFWRIGILMEIWKLLQSHIWEFLSLKNPQWELSDRQSVMKQRAFDWYHRWLAAGYRVNIFPISNC